LVPEPVHNFQCNDTGLPPWRQDWHAVAFAWVLAVGRQRAAGELRKNPARGGSTPRRQFLGSLKNVRIDVQRSSHLLIITQQSSSVNDASHVPANQFQQQRAQPCQDRATSQSWSDLLDLPNRVP